MPSPEREAYLLGYNAAKKGAKLTDPVPAHVHSAMNERYSVRRALVQGFKDGKRAYEAAQEITQPSVQVIRNGAIVHDRTYDMDKQADVFALATGPYGLFTKWSARKKLSQILAKGFDETADKEVS